MHAVIWSALALLPVQEYIFLLWSEIVYLNSGCTEGASCKQNEPDMAVITVIGKDVYGHSYSNEIGEEL